MDREIGYGSLVAPGIHGVWYGENDGLEALTWVAECSLGEVVEVLERGLGRTGEAIAGRIEWALGSHVISVRRPFNKPSTVIAVVVAPDVYEEYLEGVAVAPDGPSETEAGPDPVGDASDESEPVAGEGLNVYAEAFSDAVARIDVDRFAGLVELLGREGWPELEWRWELFGLIGAIEGATEFSGPGKASGDLLIPGFDAAWNWSGLQGRVLRLACPIVIEGEVEFVHSLVVDRLRQRLGRCDIEQGDVYRHYVWHVPAGVARVLVHLEFEVCTLDICSDGYFRALAEEG